ncbi:MAG: CHAT domain-containing protein [Bryobacteraceae bacterium]
MALARNWTLAEQGGQAIVITGRTFPYLCLPDRVFAAKRHRTFEGIADMIRAGDGGATPILPTVVRMRFSRGPAKTSTGEQGLDPCTLELARDAYLVGGPLTEYFDEECEKRGLRTDEFGPFGDLSASSQAIASVFDKDRGNAAMSAALDLWKALPESGIMRSFPDIAKKARELLFEQQPNEFPCLFILHIVVSSAEMIAVPLDLALNRWAGTGHICARIPVTWRVKTEHAPKSTDDDKLLNSTGYHYFRAISSCHESCIVNGLRFPAVTNAEEHVQKVLASLRLPAGQSRHVVDGDSLREAMDAEQEKKCCAYVLTHGLVGDGTNALVVGPSSGDGSGARVRAAQLAAESGHRRRFVYFNCCKLGHQQTEQEFRSRYFGGFAHEMLQRGVCHELICNRWPVTEKWALRLAEEFYLQRPSTAPARAMALFNARVRIEREMSRAGEEIDPTWLAPVHLWSE